MAKIWQYFEQDFRKQQRKDVQTVIKRKHAKIAPTPSTFFEHICELLAPATTKQHVSKAQLLCCDEQQQRNPQGRQRQTLQLATVADDALQQYANASVSCRRRSNAAASTLASFPSFVACASTAVAYNMNPAAYTDAATLELKRKTPFNKKLLHVGSNLDSRSFLYLTLLVLIYCCVLIRASAAAAASASTAVAHLEELQQRQPQLSPPNSLRQAVDNKVPMSLATSNVSVASATSQNNDANSAAAALSLPAAAATANPNPKLVHRRGLSKRDAANVPDDEDDSSYHDDEFDEYDALINNKSAKGKYIGAPCDDMTCEPTLLHVICDKETLTCGCEKNYPVQLGLIKGCDKPKKLGEQCFYDKTCIYNDENSLCVQVRHNAMCQCASGFHSVSYTKPTRRVFCTQDLKELTSDLPTLLGVTSGIAVLAGLICMVLHLFSKTKYPRHRNFGDANLPPPIMYSSDTGIPLTVHSGRPSSRSSLRSSASIGSYGNRRSSSAGAGPIGGGSKGILVSTSRTGSRRPSLASVHSTSSSVRSYSMMRFEKEAQQKEIRQEMKLRLARLQQQNHLTHNKPQIVIGDTLLHHHALGIGMGSGNSGVLSRITMGTPSPLTPSSMDELLPVVEETLEYTTKLDVASGQASGPVAVASLNAIRNVAIISATTSAAATTSSSATVAAAAASPQLAEAAAYIGPCSSSTEELE